ncbi:MAG: hypothetical protein JO225_00905 [Candidatus Eremiobacteraeota bacterium]|nr:hypothetical protein [Candidatus Eremiobacteraeota bacterium]
MCADSMLTLNGAHPLTNDHIETTFENAEKIAALGKKLPAAAMVSGAADIQGRLVSSFLRDASREINLDPNARNDAAVVQKVFETIDDPYAKMLDAVRNEFAKFYSQVDRLAEINVRRTSNGFPQLTEVRPEQIAISNEENPPADPVETVNLTPLTIVVCTYFEADGQRATELTWPGGRRRVCVPGPSPLWWWGSGGAAIARLMRGFDLSLLQDHSESGAPDAEEAKQVLDYAARFALAYLMPTPVQSMPLQDAIEFTEYLGQTACGYDRFKMGAAGVGGPLEILVLRRGHRKWVRRKRIHSGLATRSEE